MLVKMLKDTDAPVEAEGIGEVDGVSTDAQLWAGGLKLCDRLLRLGFGGFG